MKIFTQIVSAMADVEPIAKCRRSDKQGYSFRGIDDIMNDLQPVLKKHGLFVVPCVKNVQRQKVVAKSGGTLLYSIITMDFTMYADDGSSIAGTTVGEGMDSGDKASNKAMSVALKYFLLQVFCIPTEDQKDPENDSHEVVRIQTKDSAEYVSLKGALIDYVNAGYFKDPAVVNATIAARDIAKMKEMLDVAKTREQAIKEKAND